MKKKKKFRLTFLDVSLIGILIAVLVTTFILPSSKISGNSMEPNFHDGTYVTVLNQNFLSTFARFDLIVAKIPNNIALDNSDSSGSTLFFKRVIGVEGEKVEFKNNELYINSVKVNQNFLDVKDSKYYTNNFSTTNIAYYDELGVKKNVENGIIPKGYYFVMGDNRGVSKDSRTIGLIKKSQIVGEVKFVLYPWKYFGIKEIRESKN